MFVDYIDTVDCPYCEHENDMSDGTTDLPDSLTFDHECEKCEKEFEVEVDFSPNYYSDEIIYEECERCKEPVRDSCNKGKTHPWPKNTEENVLCRNCFLKSHDEERD